MEDKCFCHLNGYRVKDAEARNRIEVLEDKIENIEIPEGDIKSTEYSMPLGLIAYATNNLYTNDLPHECDEELLKIVGDIMDSHEGANEGTLYPTNITIVNTTESVTADGVTVENPSPRHLIFDRVAIHYKGEGENEPTLDSITLNGYEPVSEGTYTDGHFDKGSVKLLIQFVKSSETGEYTLTGVPGKLIIGKLEVPTTKYVDDAIANIEVTGGDVDLTGYATEEYVNNAIANIDIPEGEASSYPAYHIYATIGIDQSATVDPSHSSKLCTKLEGVFNDCKAKKYNNALIVVDAYSQQYVLTFRYEGLRNYTPYNKVTLEASRINGANGEIVHSIFEVSVTYTNNVFTVSQVKITPTKMKIVTKENITPILTEGTLTDINGEGATGTWSCTQMGKMCLLQARYTVPANSTLGVTLTSPMPAGHTISQTYSNRNGETTIEVLNMDGTPTYLIGSTIDATIDTPVVSQLIYFIN